MLGLDRKFFYFVQDEVVTLIKITKNTSANKLVSKVKAFSTMPNLVTVLA